VIGAEVERLGISPEVLAFFHIDELCFDYGEDREVYKYGFHYIPTTTNVWLAGNRYAPEVVITGSAMEAVAWYALNYAWYRDPLDFLFVSLGNLPCEEQIAWLKREFPKRKFSLVFGDHVLGGLCDIKVGLLLAGYKAALRWQKEKAGICVVGRTIWLNASHCSLNRFEKTSGIRTGIRTRKPPGYVTYLAKLQDDPQR
jgi:hypothetical protein